MRFDAGTVMCLDHSNLNRRSSRLNLGPIVQCENERTSAMARIAFLASIIWLLGVGTDHLALANAGIQIQPAELGSLSNVM